MNKENWIAIGGVIATIIVVIVNSLVSSYNTTRQIKAAQAKDHPLITDAQTSLVTDHSSEKLPVRRLSPSFLRSMVAISVFGICVCLSSLVILFLVIPAANRFEMLAVMIQTLYLANFSRDLFYTWRYRNDYNRWRKL